MQRFNPDRSIFHQRHGLTLLELLGVVVIMSLVASAGSVSLKYITEKSKVRHTIDRLTWLHENTRRLATSTQEDLILEFDVKSGTCTRKRLDGSGVSVVGRDLVLSSIETVDAAKAGPIQLRYPATGTSDWCLIQITSEHNILLSGSTSQAVFPIETSDAKAVLAQLR